MTSRLKITESCYMILHMDAGNDDEKAPGDDRRRRGRPNHEPRGAGVGSSGPADRSRLTVTEAARHFSDLVHRAFYRGESFVLTKGGRNVAEIVPVRGSGGIRASDLRARLVTMPRLGDEEAEEFERDIDEARRATGPSEGDPWGRS